MMSNSRNNNTEQFSEMFKALSNPHRLKIFMRLVDCCEPGVTCEVDSDEMKACVGQVGKDLGIVPSTVSHHIKELHQAGLIRMERRGQNVDCWIDSEAIRGLAGFFVGLNSDGEGNNDEFNENKLIKEGKNGRERKL
jgi:ArsR family transcriptional regulator